MLPTNQGTPRIPLGLGAVKYGGTAVRGRERMKQYNEHNDGIRPSLDYRSAEFAPVVSLDVGMDGAPIVIFAGSVLAQAYIDNAGVVTEVPHAIALANGGVRCALNYGANSVGNVEDITNLGTILQSEDPSTEDADIWLGANRPIGIASGNVYSAAMEKINRNWKLQDQTMVHCDYLVEFGVDNAFMSKGTLVKDSLIQRTAYGVADYTMDLENDAVLKGIQTGDIVTVNPYLPGSLISVTDLEAIVAAKGTGTDVIATALIAAWGGTKACASYIVEQKVGKVEKRQTFMQLTKTATSVEISARDAYAESLNMVTTATGFGLSGKDSGGVDAHLHSAYTFAHAVSSGTANGAITDVANIWVNLQF